MRVLHQINGLSIGGVETFVYRLCKYANEETYVYSHSDGVVRAWLEQLGIEVFLKKDISIEDIIKQKEIDILVMHTGSYLPEYVQDLRNKFPNLKFIQVLHTIYSSDDKWVDKIICVSKEIYNKNPFSNAILIYPGVDRKDSICIGDVARLAPYKYTNDLMWIVSEATKRTNRKINLEIIGEEAKDAPGYKEFLIEKSKELGINQNTYFWGYKPTIDYKKYDIFIHLVGNEAYPVTILEALANNIFTISYIGKGTSEIMHPLFYTFDCKEKIADFVSKIIEEIMSLKHCKEVAEDFSKVYGDIGDSHV